MPPPPWTPAAGDVHEVIPRRHPGGFTVGTTPTVTEVESVATGIVSELEALLGGVLVPDEHADFANLVASVGAAAEVERSFFPDAAGVPGSVYEHLADRYEDLRASLLAIVAGIATPGEDGATVSHAPRGVFPEPVGVESWGF